MANALWYTDQTASLVLRRGRRHRPVPGLDQSHIPIGWTPDGKSLLVVDVDSDAAVTVVEALDLTTGQRHPWKSLMPARFDGRRRNLQYPFCREWRGIRLYLRELAF